MAHLSVHLLGPFHATLDGNPITGFESSKVRALLAYLMVEADHPHSREALAGFLWPDQPERSARHNLSQALSNLRQAIHDRDAEPPFLHVTRGTVQFNLASDHWLDVTEFTAHVVAVERHPHFRLKRCELCIRQLEQSVALYRGEFLTGFFVDESIPFSEWATLLRERSHRQMLDALYHLAEHHETRRDYDRARRYARRQVELEPWREEAHQQLMRLLAHSGQRSAALQQYEICRRSLAEELNVEPHPETTALYERIRTAGGARPHNLPLQLTSLVGRERELSEIAERLADPDCRLLTLTGLGGIGKTRLALQVAREQIGAFLHGVYFVPLAAVGSDAFLASTIADVLGFSFSGEQPPETQLLNYLREKEMLLVLDSFEHLLSPRGTRLVLEILKQAPGLKLLVTSRERLNLQAEWFFQIRGLAFPAQHSGAGIEAYSAVRLFFERARQVEAGFSLSEATIPATVRICQLVEGMPLGLELAAASIPASSCEKVAAAIERNLDTLATSMQDVPERHRSARAAFEHSWNLLSEEEQQVLQKLAAFRGAFEAQAAQEVTAASPWILSLLLNKSLLRINSARRYEIHELVRQFAAEKLNQHPVEKETAYERHCEYYASFLHQREEPLKRGQQKEALAEISAGIENIRAAWQWAVTHQRPELIALCIESFYYFYWARNWFHEGKQVFEQAAKAVKATSAQDRLLRARIGTRQAEFDSWLAHYDEAKAGLQKSVEICRTLHAQRELSLALELFGRIEYWQGEHPQAKEHFQESLAICRQIGDQIGAAQALNSLANVICEMEADYDQAQLFYKESLAISRQIGDQFGVAKALINLGALAQEQGDYPEAKQLYQESLKIYREIDYRHGQSAAQSYLGQVASLLGEYTLAQELLQESLDMNRETGDQHAIAERLKQLGDVAYRREAHQEAQKYFGAALRLAMKIRTVQVALDILVRMARLFRREGKNERALELAVFVTRHAAAGQEVKNRARGLLSELEAELSPQAAARCRERGQADTLEAIVTDVLDDNLYLAQAKFHSSPPNAGH